MSISNSLLRAAKLQEKIDLLRGQLSELLVKAQAEIAAETDHDRTLSPLHVPSRKLKLARGSRLSSSVANASERKASGKEKETKTRRRGRPSPLAGHKRPASPTGPLAPAVVKVLRAKRRPMKVHDILAGLMANGYQFNSSEPKKNLAARIYRLKGVKQVDAGLFGLV